MKQNYTLPNGTDVMAIKDLIPETNTTIMIEVHVLIDLLSDMSYLMGMIDGMSKAQVLEEGE